MAHAVQVDESGIEDFFSREAANGVDPGEPGPGSPGETGPGTTMENSGGGEWDQLTGMVAQFLAYQGTPAWEVPEEIQQGWAAALSGVLDKMFPGGPAGVENWGPWAVLLMASGKWVLCGIDLRTMTIKPLREQPEEAPPVPHEGEGDHSAPGAVTTGGGAGFSTGG